MKVKSLITSIASAAFVLTFAVASAASALTVSCAGVASASNITWAASSSGGVLPIAYLWGNGSTSTSQTIAVAPGTYTMALQATDASSTLATTTCSSTVNATTTSTTVSAQIQNLLNQIAALKAQILALLQQQTGGGSGNTATSTPTSCFNFGRDLHDGDRGDDVRELQRTLATDPSIFPPGLITGFFGHRTEEALKKFQKKFGIASTSTGFFGPRSRAFMSERCGSADNDHDGIVNAADTDDDNDGIPDVSDKHPFKPNNATSTSTATSSSNGDRGNSENGRGRGSNKGSRDD